MMHTELMVLPQHGVIKHGTEVVEYEHDLDDSEEYDDAEVAETFADVSADVQALELRYTADRERCETAIGKLNNANGDIILELNILHAKLIKLQADMEESDDLEDQANAADLKKAMDETFVEDTDHETRDNEADADRDDAQARAQRNILIAKCNKIYKAIARSTHPDKCRNMSDAEKSRRREMFLAARALLSSFDIEALELIHLELYGKTFEPINLVQRLIRARQKREDLRKKIEAMQHTPEWQLFCVYLRFGEEVAISQHRMGLEHALNGLRQMVSQLENPQPDSNTYWA